MAPHSIEWCCQQITRLEARVRDFNALQAAVYRTVDDLALDDEGMAIISVDCILERILDDAEALMSNYQAPPNAQKTDELTSFFPSQLAKDIRPPKIPRYARASGQAPFPWEAIHRRCMRLNKAKGFRLKN